MIFFDSKRIYMLYIPQSLRQATKSTVLVP
jgi:hypothetical protein